MKTNRLKLWCKLSALTIITSVMIPAAGVAQSSASVTQSLIQIKDCGAVGDGVTPDDTAFKQASGRGALLKDKAGRWNASFFGNDRPAPRRVMSGYVPVQATDPGDDLIIRPCDPGAMPADKNL